jgi:hypothetical protein
MNESKRSSPLFRVFATLPGARRPWQVCSVNLEGEPKVVEATYRSLKQALAQAARANEVYGELLKCGEPQKE